MDLNTYNITGKCRFCHSEGFHRDLMKEYEGNNLSEIYLDIFQECFNLYLCIVSNQSSLICMSCIKQLRDANSFRAMVVKAEQDLLQASEQDPVFININDAWSNKDRLEVNSKDMVKLENCDSTLDNNIQDCNIGKQWNSNTNVKSEEILENSLDSYSIIDQDCCSDNEIQGENELLSRFAGLKPLPTRRTLYKTYYKFAKQLDSLKGKNVKATDIKALLQKQNKTSSTYVTEKSTLLNNIMQLLQNSNLAPFQPKRRSGILCLYCSKPFDNFQNLHSHQESENCKKSMKKVLNKKCSESLIIYAHINELKCTICNTSLDFNALKTHLMTVHKQKFFPSSERVVPFKLIKGNEFICQICGFSFETFGSIERHMNTHYRNYVCECGAGYMTKNRLKVHWRYSHKNGSFPCEICKKTFPSQHKYNCHYDVVHRSVKKNKCTKCPARFADYFNKHKHMVEVHGEPPLEYRCNVCDAIFKRRYALLCHVRRRHLEMKNVNCELCSYKCYTVTELKVHMIKHVGERTNQCGICKKAYARKKTLKEHMRIHANDRRFVCAICGQGFVQNCSLKGHMRSHHADSELAKG
ncbi:zinc finger protein 808 [Pieris rapae]|uniref:zinc finger protein 808 n=1 Tax=Pieris rapae TaxID=64459 RepID=UPI001E2809E8|nr:zinc finger protein 808 [Pieris rapae]